MNRIRFALNALLILGIVVTSVQCVKKEQTNVNNPVAILYISPTSGTLTTVFTFDGSASHDGNNLSEGMMYRWDADSDGNYDLDWTTSSSVQVNFNVAGTFTVTMEVKTADGKTATDSKQVTVTDNGGGQLPTVTTTQVSGITQNAAISGGNVSSDGGSDVTARGVCWSTITNPTTSNPITSDGTGTGTFTSNLSALSENTTYYVRAYATNSEGTAYGNEVSFTTTSGGGSGQPCPGVPTVTYQGQTYNTVLIGSQCWLKENLNYETGNSWCYNNDPANGAIYGRLYDWETLMNGAASSNMVPSGVQGICPAGWHVPSDEEWLILMAEVGPAGGYLLKSTTGWQNSSSGGNGNGSNESGFTALPGGIRYDDGTFNMGGGMAFFWTSTEWEFTWEDDARQHNLSSDGNGIGTGESYKTTGLSVRCVKD